MGGWLAGWIGAHLHDRALQWLEVTRLHIKVDVACVSWQVLSASGAVGSPAAVRAQDAGDSYSVSSITQSISARLTAAVRVQPCVTSTVYQDAYCLPILLRIASSNDLRSQGGMDDARSATRCSAGVCRRTTRARATHHCGHLW